MIVRPLPPAGATALAGAPMQDSRARQRPPRAAASSSPSVSAGPTGSRGDAEIESHLDLGSAVVENTDQDPLAQLGHQLESQAEAGAWNLGCAAAALVGDPDAEERSFAR